MADPPPRSRLELLLVVAALAVVALLVSLFALPGGETGSAVSFDSKPTWEDGIATLQTGWGHESSFASQAPEGPACRESADAGTPNGRSVLFVSVSTPTSARSAVDASPDGAVVVDGIAPAGVSSVQALPSLFAGALPFGVDAGFSVVPFKFRGLPEELSSHGYETFAAARVDLTFGNRRAILRELGFETLVEPTGPDEKIDVVSRLQEEIETLRRESPTTPFFAFIHAPDPEPLRRWYRTTERERGTILVLTALRADPASDRWLAPLILEGTDLEPPGGVRGRLGSHTDVHTTMRELLGMPPARCEQGISLLRESWPEHRLTATFAGSDSLRIFRGKETWTTPGEGAPDEISRFGDALQRVGFWLARNDAFSPDRRFVPKRAGTQPHDPPLVLSHRGNVDGPRPDGAANRARDFDAALEAGFDWLELDVGITADRALVVMHETVLGVPSNHTYVRELTLEQLRADGRAGEILTFDEALEKYGVEAGILVDVKPTMDSAFDQELAAQVARRAISKNGRRLYQSFSHSIAAYIAHACRECEVGWLTPPETPVDERAVEAALIHELDFISVRHDLVPPALVSKAREMGVRVFVYGVNDPAELEKFGSAMPDGIITDHRRMLHRPDSSAD